MADFNSSLPVRTENNGDIVAKIGDKTTPSQQLAIDASGNASVTVQNTAGNPVPIQGGNATAVNTADAADGPVSPGTAAAKSILTGGQYNLTLPTATTGQQVAVQLDASGRTLVAQPTASVLQATARLNDGAGNSVTSQTSGAQRALDVGVNVAGVQVDPRSIRALTSADVVQANIKDGTGTAFSASNPLPVQVVNSLAGTPVNDYNTAAAVAAGATSNHDYAITASKTFYAKKFWASSSGKLKIEVQTSPDGVTFTSKWVGFNSTATPNITIDFDLHTITDTGTGSKIRIIRTNEDKAAQDVYSTISGMEI